MDTNLPVKFIFKIVKIFIFIILQAKKQYTICLTFIRHLLNYVKQNLNMVKENINNFTLMKWEICKSESFYADYLGENLKKHSR